MTAIWGPLGWMTLHSVATCYPDTPTAGEQALMSTWLDMFRDTITCPSCREHFTTMLANYRQAVPNMLTSRQTFAVFTFRAHNAVNRRLNKPIHGDVESCMNILKGNVKTRSARDYRISYLHHISRHWRSFRDASGISALRKITEMNKIELEYIGPRDRNFEVTLQPDVVVLPRDALERRGVEEQPSRVSMNPRFAPPTGFRFAAGGIRLRR
jgi:hypothetical protein